MRRAIGLWTLAFLMLVGLPMVVGASGPKAENASPQASETVEMFQAMREGRIEVKFIAKDAKEASVLIKNKTDKPLTVKLPDAFAATPVLAQLDGGLGRNSSSSTTTNQAIGGGWGSGMMGGMGGMGGMGMGGGMWNVPPEKIAQVKVPVVCLEHGKPDPRPAVPYQIKPLDEFTKTPGLREVLHALGNGAVSQRVAQVAAWHLQNGMSFQELASKQIRFANGSRCPYFSPAEIQAAMQLVTKAKQMAEKHQQQTPSPSPGDSLSRN
ncbi:MAG TPA: hypothetical protein PK777_15930 [Thermoguttaceae bacterium]|nr:hypothetical protein [Thermoguttaceae bacterium]HPP54442.1 hypothetical protein [Thermoguttaceae bacterium]